MPKNDGGPAIEIRFGGLAPKLHEQAQVPAEVLEWEQKMADGILLCKVHGIVTEGRVEESVPEARQSHRQDSRDVPSRGGRQVSGFQVESTRRVRRVLRGMMALEDFQFFANLALHMPIQEDRTRATIGADGRNIYYNPTG